MLQRAIRAALVFVVIAPLAAVAVVTAPAPAHAQPFFADTAGTSYNNAVQVLSAEGIIRGCTEDEFCPGGELTREQMASLLARALELPTATSSPFHDVAGTHAANVGALAEAGITQGCTDTEFCPQDPITREQMASMLVRAFDVPPAGERFFEDANGSHGQSINALAAEGIAAGCQDPLTQFCARDHVLRSQTALFLARAMDFIDRVEVTPLNDRQDRQDQIDADREREVQRASDRNEVWDRLAQCESGGNWSINTGNGYYGGLQFALESWRAVGGSGYPHQASRDEQIRRGEMLQARQGWGAWPHCSRQLGLR